MCVIAELDKFFNDYKGRKEIIGRTENNKNIYCLYVGNEKGKRVLIQCGIHAREYITVYLGMDLVSALNNSELYFAVVPAVNVDGIILCQNGINEGYTKEQQKFLLYVNGSNDFSQWKANIRGVDLNQNFDAKWGKAPLNKLYPSNSGYIGKMPFSESESLALKNLTLNFRPDFTVSYHSKGEELYWQFGDNVNNIRHRKLAYTFASAVKYNVRSTPQSVGGYKDWCILKLNIPSVTVEVGSDKLSHPITKKYRKTIFKRNFPAYSEVARIL